MSFGQIVCLSGLILPILALIPVYAIGYHRYGRPAA